MYSTCLFCNRPLGSNEVVERFPVGRRLAFDSAKGRLWVVCRKCERWNLSPVEERWEAIEACERLFRGARMRMSTDQIGLARLKEGLELVRIGEPLRPEFAAWRYGDQFGRRRRRAILWMAAGIAVTGAVVVGAAAAGISMGAVAQLPNAFSNLPVRARVRTQDGRVLKIRNQNLQKTKIIPSDDANEWSLLVKHTGGLETFHGDEALRVAGLLLPKVNYMAGSKKVVSQAVERIETAGAPEVYLAGVAREVQGMGTYRPGIPTVPAKKLGLLRTLPAEARLALEMALHEEQERVALAGDLVQLELAWRVAEEVAGIADNLFVPPEHEAFIERHRPGTGAEPGDGDDQS